MLRRRSVRAEMSSNWPNREREQDPALLTVRKSSRSKSVDSGTKNMVKTVEEAPKTAVRAKTSGAKKSRVKCLHCMFKEQKEVQHAENSLAPTFDQRLEALRAGLSASSSMYSWEKYFKLQPSVKSRLTSLATNEDSSSISSGKTFS